jgi:hypothetical protein
MEGAVKSISSSRGTDDDALTPDVVGLPLRQLLAQPLPDLLQRQRRRLGQIRQ